MPEPRSLSLELEAVPTWSDVERVREAVRSWVGMVAESEELRDALSMAAAELLENAVKYGPGAGAPIRLLVVARGARIEVAVTQGEPDPDATRALEERLAWIAAQPSAQAAYEAALGGERTGSSGLGLVRIAYEAGCALASSREGGTLTVRATRAA